MKIIVKEPTPLLEFLFKNLTGYKRTTVKNLLRFRSIAVNGKLTTQFDFPLKPGDTVLVESDQSKAQREDIKTELRILYEDSEIVVIDKPSGLLTVSTEKVKTNTAYYKLYDYLKLAQTPVEKRSRRQPLFIVHRLDKDASGLIVFAKNPSAKLWLQENWHLFQKKYFAIVYGEPGRKKGTIESYLAENQTLKVYSSPKPSRDAKHAVTHYLVLKSNGQFSQLEVELETGRKHQIRVHLADIGHPIVGDDKYGGDFKNRRAPISRLALHAHSLVFLHPKTRKKMIFQSDLPRELDIIESRK